MNAHITVNVSANIPEQLSDMLNQVAQAEERSKSYYIKKGLELILRERLEDLADYQEAQHAYNEFIDSHDQPVPIDEVFKDIK